MKKHRSRWLGYSVSWACWLGFFAYIIFPLLSIVVFPNLAPAFRHLSYFNLQIEGWTILAQSGIAILFWQLTALVAKSIPGSRQSVVCDLLMRPRGADSRVFANFLYSVAALLILSLVIVAIRSGQGVWEAGRGHSLFTPAWLILKSLFNAAFCYAILRSERRSGLLAISFIYLTILGIESLALSGSRRIFIYPILFIFLPMMMGASRISSVVAPIIGAFVLIAVPLYGGFRGAWKNNNATDALTFALDRAANSIQFVAVNLDVFMVFDAFVGIIKKVPAEVDFLYGQTLSKIFVFWVPRSVWPEKPESISTIVAREIYGFINSSQSFNPNLLGEFYFNFGLAGPALAGTMVGLINSVVKPWTRQIQANNVFRAIAFLGVVRMMLFDLWRGYTFEVLLGFVIFLGLFVSLAWISPRGNEIHSRPS